MTIANRQHALAVASGFVLDQIRTGRRSLDLVDALIVLAVTQTNIEPVLRDPVLQRAHSSDRGHAFHAMVGAYST